MPEPGQDASFKSRPELACASPADVMMAISRSAPLPFRIFVDSATITRRALEPLEAGKIVKLRDGLVAGDTFATGCATLPFVHLASIVILAVFPRVHTPVIKLTA